MDCVREDEGDPRPMLMFNPTIVASSEETSVYEGLPVAARAIRRRTRPAEVEVEWMTAMAICRKRPCRPLGHLRSMKLTTSMGSCSLIGR